MKHQSPEEREQKINDRKKENIAMRNSKDQGVSLEKFYGYFKKS